MKPGTNISLNLNKLAASSLSEQSLSPTNRAAVVPWCGWRTLRAGGGGGSGCAPRPSPPSSSSRTTSSFSSRQDNREDLGKFNPLDTIYDCAQNSGRWQNYFYINLVVIYFTHTVTISCITCEMTFHSTPSPTSRRTRSVRTATRTRTPGSCSQTGGTATQSSTERTW